MSNRVHQSTSDLRDFNGLASGVRSCPPYCHEWHSRGRRFDPAWLHQIPLINYARRASGQPAREGSTSQCVTREEAEALLPKCYNPAWPAPHGTASCCSAYRRSRGVGITVAGYGHDGSLHMQYLRSRNFVLRRARTRGPIVPLRINRPLPQYRSLAEPCSVRPIHIAQRVPHEQIHCRDRNVGLVRIRKVPCAEVQLHQHVL
jgi:hypothetical protein